ncbi:MAG: PilZ domain-containing protein [Erythrobacter sp.]
MRPAPLPSETTSADKIGRRGAPRLHLMVPAKLMSVAETQNCVLLDISQSGARIWLDRPLSINSCGYLKVGPLEVFVTALRCTMLAAGGGINGLQFDHLLTKSQVLMLRSYSENYQIAERRATLQQARRWVMGGE